MLPTTLKEDVMWEIKNVIRRSKLIFWKSKDSTQKNWQDTKSQPPGEAFQIQLCCSDCFYLLMGDVEEYRCFIGGLSWSITDNTLKDAFEKFGHLTEAKVVVDKFSGRSRGFGFVTFDEKRAMEDAIDEMNGISLDGRSITVDKAQPQGSSRDRDGGRDYDRDRDRDRGRSFGGGRGSGGDCFKCGKPGHFARECPNDGGRGDRYSGRDDRYGGRDDRSGGGGGSNRYGPDRGGDRYSGRSRDGGGRGGSVSDRYNRDRSGPYERPSGGSYRS